LAKCWEGREPVEDVVEFCKEALGRGLPRAKRIAVQRRPSFVTNYIEAEAHAVLLRKLGRSLAPEWLLAGGLPVVRVLPQEEDRAKELIARYTDKDWSLCDAISFAVMERRGVRTAFSFDVHFRQYGKLEVLGL
jgi:uncharacterized protein